MELHGNCPSGTPSVDEAHLRLTSSLGPFASRSSAQPAAGVGLHEAFCRQLAANPPGPQLPGTVVK